MKYTLYELLEVSQTASAEAVIAAHARLVQTLQARAEAGDAAAKIRLTAVKEAYAVLSDAGRRASYDATLAAPATQGAGAVPRVPRARPSAALYDEFGERTGPGMAWKVGAGVLVLLLLLGGYKLYRNSELKAEQLRIEKSLALERERLELERQRLESARAIEQQRLDLQRSREEQRQQMSQSAAERNRAAQDYNLRAMQEQREAAAQRQQRFEEQQRSREQQTARDRERIEAERRLRAEKEELRRACMARYNRPDC